MAAAATLLLATFSMSAGSGIVRAATQPDAGASTVPAQAEPINCSGRDQAGELPSGARSLGGMVTDGGGHAVPDIQVRLDVDGVGRRTTFTSAEGRYLFESLGDGTYDVSFDDANGAYIDGYYDGGPTALSPATGTPVTLSGSDALNVNATLAPESLHTVSGVVTDNGGSRVPGALVRASGTYFLGLVGCYRTDADGTFAIPAVRTGVYQLDVSAPGEPSGFYDDAIPVTHFSIHEADATLVTVAADIAGLTIQFPPTVSLSGVVLDSTNSPVGDVGVSACPIGGGECGVASSDPGDGTFTIGGLVADSYTVGENDSSGSNRYLSGYYAGAGLFTADAAEAATVAVPGGSIQLLAVAAPQVSGIVTDAGGQLDDIVVSICDADYLNCFQGSTGTDGTGSYHIGVPVAGTYVAQVYDNSQNHPSGGYIPAVGTTVTQDAGLARQITVVDASILNVNAFLPAGGRIQVSLTSGGQPVDGYVQFCREEFVCPDGANVSGGSAVSPAMFAGTYKVQATVDFESFSWYRDGMIASLVFTAGTPVVIGNDGSTTSIAVQVPGTGTATPTGTNVSAPLADPSGGTPVTLTFATVTGDGTSSLTESDTGSSLPDGFQLGLPTVYYDISTTATFTGSIKVCISYVGITFLNGTGLKLYHYDSSIPGWKDITTTVNETTKTICGLTTSLSPFVIVERKLTFGGFFGPKAPPTLNGAKAGDTVGVQFGLGGDVGLSVFADGSPTVSQVNCSTGAAIGTPGVATGTIKYNKRTGLYTYSWTTSKTWKNTCRELTFVFRDGETASVRYRLKS